MIGITLVHLVFLAGWGLLCCRRFVRLLKRAHHVLFQSLFFKLKAVLVPDKVWVLDIELVTLHASLKQVQNVAVVRVSGETERSAVLHELFKLSWLVQTELVNCNLLLLALNIVIFFVLASTWKTLPWK